MWSDDRNQSTSFNPSVPTGIYSHFFSEPAWPVKIKRCFVFVPALLERSVDVLWFDMLETCIHIHTHSRIFPCPPLSCAKATSLLTGFLFPRTTYPLFVLRHLGCRWGMPKRRETTHFTPLSGTLIELDSFRSNECLEQAAL